MSGAMSEWYRYLGNSLMIYFMCLRDIRTFQWSRCDSTFITLFLQAHARRPGLDCLSNEQVIHLLLAMDSDTLLDCGRASLRLYRLVCDRQVWRSLLKNISDFSKEKVEDLLVFATEGGPDMTPEMTKGSPEMLPEILKEAARRIKFCDRRPGSEQASEQGQGDEGGIIKRVKIAVTVQGWDSETFEVDGTRLEELTGVAEAVGEKFIMVEVHDFNSLETNIDTYRKIAAHLEKQEERLVLLQTPNFNLNTNTEMAEFFLTLQKKCMEWKVTIFMMGSVQDDSDPEEYWAYLDKICSSNGHISILFFVKSQGIVRLESVRKAWEISGLMNIWTVTDVPLEQLANLRGGRDCVDWETEWEKAVEALQ